MIGSGLFAICTRGRKLSGSCVCADAMGGRGVHEKQAVQCAVLVRTGQLL